MYARPCTRYVTERTNNQPGFYDNDIHTTKARKAPHKMLINYANYDDSHKVNYIQLPSN